MANLLHIVNTERRALRIVGTGATVGASGNTQVVLFTGLPTALQGTQFAIGQTAVAPTAGSANWINVVSDAVGGTTFKFNRRGVFEAQMTAVMTSGTALPAQIGITIDAVAAALLVATPLGVATAGLIDYSTSLGIAASQQTMKARNPVYITDALAGGAQVTAGLGSSGTGVLRFHASTGAGAVVSTALIVTEIRVEITACGDLVG
jgi:hypothetical protein